MDLIVYLKNNKYQAITFLNDNREITTHPLAKFKSESDLFGALNIKPELAQYFPYDAEPCLVFIEKKQSIRIKLLASSPSLETI